MSTRDVIYKITMSDGGVRIGPPRRLAAVLATYNHDDDGTTPRRAGVTVAKIQVAVVTEWDDVTERFVRKPAA